MIASALLALALSQTPVPPPLRMEITLQGEIDSDMAQGFIKALSGAPLLGDIVVKINSPGGDLDAAINMAHALEAKQALFPVRCVVDGEAASAAFYLLQSCAKRQITERSSVMMHAPIIRGVISINDPATETVSRTRYLKALLRQTAGQFAARMKLSRVEIEKYLHSDWWMTPEEALATGAVDEIVPAPNSELGK